MRVVLFFALLVILGAWSCFRSAMAQEQDMSYLRASAAATATAAMPTTPLYAGSYALIVAVSDYANGWPRLPGVHKDADTVRAALESHGFTVTVVDDPDREQFDAAMDTFVTRYAMAAQNRIVVYYLGHGHTLKDFGGNEMGYVVTVDAPLPSVDEAGFRVRAVPLQRYAEYSRKMKAKHVMFVFDSCFAGTVFSELGAMRSAPTDIYDKVRYPVRFFLTSGAADERVPDVSIFSPAFALGLTGAADLDADGYISGTELGTFLNKVVINDTGNLQHPCFGALKDMKSDRGDFVFQVAASGRASVMVPADVATPAAAQRADEYVIAVTPFYGAAPGAAAAGMSVKQLVERSLYDNLQGVPGVRVELNSADTVVRTDDEARAVARELGAAVVIWGDVILMGDDVEILPRATRMPTFERLRHRSQQTDSSQRPAPYRDLITYAQASAADIANIAMTQAADYFQYLNPQRALYLAGRARPQTSETLRLQAAIHWNANNGREALRCIEEAIALAPNNMDLLVLRSRILVSQNETQRAQAVMRDAHTIAPDSPFPLLQLGSIAYNKGQYSEAMEFYKAGLALSATDRYEDHMRLGLALDRAGRYGEALEHYERAAQLDSSSAETFIYSGMVYHALGDDSEAMRRARKARSLSNSAFISNRVGGLLISGGAYEEAVAILESVRKAEPEEYSAWQNLAAALGFLDRHEEALAVLAEAANRWPQYGQFRLLLHVELSRAGMHEEARRRIRAVSRPDKIKDADDLLTEMFAGRLSEKEVMRKSHLDDTYGERLGLCEIHYYLGMAYLTGAPGKLTSAAPDTDRAIEHFKACLDTKVFKFVEYDYAKAELTKLGVIR